MSDETIVQRVAKLEQANRRFKAAAILMGVAAVGAIFVAAERTSPTVSAEGFRVVDREGKVRAEMGSDREGTFFYMNDENGKIRTSIAAQKTGTYLNMKDDNGKSRLVVSLDEAPMVRLRDDQGATLMTITTDKQGPMVRMGDERQLFRVIGPFSDVLSDGAEAAKQPPAPPR